MRKLIPALALVIFISSALAVGTSHWTQTTEADFKAGRFDNVVATNLGDLKLSRATQTLLTQDARISAVYAMIEESDGAIYAGTGPQGVLLRLQNGKPETAATLGDNVNLFSLAHDQQGRVLIGTGGARGAIYRIEKRGEQPVEIFSDDAAQYIWSIVATKDGNLYAATGPNGKLFEIHPDGSKKIAFECDENNLLSMVSDGKDLLFVGSDPNGHVYRINRKTGESFVMFDAPESEISALALDARGNLFAGTGQSASEETPEATEPASEKAGRPEMDQPTVIPIPSQPPKAPQPPRIPPPNPHDPPEIPKESATTRPLKMMIQPAGDDPDPIPGTEPKKSPRRRTIANAAQQAADEPRPPVNVHKGGEPPATGNAIYKIDPDGFVTEIFRQNVLVLAIQEHDDVLLVGTGGEGAVYQINPTAEETSVVVKVDPKEVLSLLPAKDGRILMGMANDGQIMSLSSGFANHGTFTSPVLDAQQVSRFGKIHLIGSLPKNTSLTLATRSGNVGEANDAGWSKWSDESPATEYAKVTSPSARFLQYRLTFGSTGGDASPVVDEVSVAYQMPNLPPVVKSIKIGAGAAPDDASAPPANNPASREARPATANPNVALAWDASDPNNDPLQYTLYFRRTDSTGGNWILLKDKLTEPAFEWNTRAVADGRYEVKVVASDALANAMNEGRSASRVSDPIEVDNTPPVIGDLTGRPGDTSVNIAARVIDRTSTVAKLEYAVDSSTDWQMVLPVDKIADSPEESYDFTIGGLAAGAHQIGLRATDAHGNQSFENVNVTIK